MISLHVYHVTEFALCPDFFFCCFVFPVWGAWRSFGCFQIARQSLFFFSGACSFSSAWMLTLKMSLWEHVWGWSFPNGLSNYTHTVDVKQQWAEERESWNEKFCVTMFAHESWVTKACPNLSVLGETCKRQAHQQTVLEHERTGYTAIEDYVMHWMIADHCTLEENSSSSYSCKTWLCILPSTNIRRACWQTSILCMQTRVQDCTEIGISQGSRLSSVTTYKLCSAVDSEYSM